MQENGFTRREFTFAVAGSAATVGALSAQEKEPDERLQNRDDEQNSKGRKEGIDDQKDSDAPEPRPESPPEAAYILGLILRRYADERLDDAAVSGIARDVYGDLARSRALSSFTLTNSDEPAFVFEAWRAD